MSGILFLEKAEEFVRASCRFLRGSQRQRQIGNRPARAGVEAERRIPDQAVVAGVDETDVEALEHSFNVILKEY